MNRIQIEDRIAQLVVELKTDTDEIVEDILSLTGKEVNPEQEDSLADLDDYEVCIMLGWYEAQWYQLQHHFAHARGEHIDSSKVRPTPTYKST